MAGGVTLPPRLCGGCGRGGPFVGPYKGPPQCKLCWLYENDPDYRAAWGGGLLPGEQGRTIICPHRGEARGTVRCPTCRGHVELKTWDCAVFGRCHVAPGKAVDGVAACDGCPKGPVVVRSLANGIGDAILGLCATGGLQRDDPQRLVVYEVQSQQKDWVALFEGYDRLILAGTAVSGGRVVSPHFSGAENADRQWSTGRWVHYAQACGTTAVRPRPRPGVVPLPDYAGAVVLAPFSVWPARVWAVQNWLALEQTLAAAGRRVVILDGFVQGPDVRRSDVFRSEAWVGRRAQEVASLMKGAHAVVSNDSGMAHVAGALGVSTVTVNSHFHEGQYVYGLYESVRCLHGHDGTLGTISVNDVLAACGL